MFRLGRICGEYVLNFHWLQKTQSCCPLQATTLCTMRSNCALILMTTKVGRSYIMSWIPKSVWQHQGNLVNFHHSSQGSSRMCLSPCSSWNLSTGFLSLELLWHYNYIRLFTARWLLLVSGSLEHHIWGLYLSFSRTGLWTQSLSMFKKHLSWLVISDSGLPLLQLPAWYTCKHQSNIRVNLNNFA